jgi:hypothetical protein
VTAGASLVRVCVCEQGFFDCTSKDLGVCKEKECSECPFDATCDQAETLETLQTNEDFWHAINNTIAFYQCPKLGACIGGRISRGNPDSQCAKDYVGVRCELCDYSIGYAIHQPGGMCSLCKPNEGRNSVFLAVAGIGGLLILVVVTGLGMWPRVILRVKRVGVISGPHAGRVGKLACNHMETDELNDALRAAGKKHSPLQPHSAFELFSRTQQAKSTNKTNAEILLAWGSAKPRTKREYEDATQQEHDQYDQKHAKHQHIHGARSQKGVRS